MIDKDIIDEALNFYNIDLQYRDKCYNCIEEINKKEKLSLEFSNLYNKLYIEDFIKIKDLWQCNGIDELFDENVNPFITNIMVLLGYNYHRKNMQQYNLFFGTLVPMVNLVFYFKYVCDTIQHIVDLF